MSAGRSPAAAGLHRGPLAADRGRAARGAMRSAILYDLDIAPMIATGPLSRPSPTHSSAEPPLSDLSVVTLQELAAHPMILLDVPPSAPRLLTIFAEHGLDPEGRFHTPSYELGPGMGPRPSPRNGVSLTVVGDDRPSCGTPRSPPCRSTTAHPAARRAARVGHRPRQAARTSSEHAARSCDACVWP
jgi:hypothetical protein